MPQHSFLQLPAMIACGVRKNLQPQVAHFVGGFIARADALRRMIRVARVRRRVVVLIAHVDHGIFRQEHRLAVIENRLPVGIPGGDAYQPLPRPVWKRGVGFEQLAEVMCVRIDGQNIGIQRQREIVGDDEIPRASGDIERLIVLELDQ